MMNYNMMIKNYFKQSSSDLCTLNILLHYMQHNNKMINMKKLVSATSVYLYFSNLYLYVINVQHKNKRINMNGELVCVTACGCCYLLPARASSLL